ncbi:MAG: DUF4349 domain-containing protein [Treponema sp.]|jgi:hypothetical protein|nr:DUF4349 domain-containing protein [Treponema sp.]
MLNHEGESRLPPHRLVLLLVVVLVCGCSKSGIGGAASASAMPAAAPVAQYAVGDTVGRGFNPDGAAGVEAPAFKSMSYGEVAEEAAPAGLEGAAPSRKLIKSARIRTRVDNLDEAAALVEAVLERYQAYSSDSSVYDTSRYYTLKVPSAHYETVLGEVGNIGKILYRSETVEDATLRYYDLDGRLNTRLELLKTFQSYLGKAETIEDIMTVETRIAELQQEIDWYGSQLVDLSHLIDYATISLELQGPVAESTYYKPSIAERIAGLFHSFSDVASIALLVLLGILIYGIPALFILILLFWVLFGRIGLLRRIWRLVAVKNRE